MVLNRHRCGGAACSPWSVRRLAVLRGPEDVHKQEYLLRHLLSAIGCHGEPLCTVVPVADTGAVRVLVRTLAGMEDFARVNASFPRRNSPLRCFAFSMFRRRCLECFVHGHQCTCDSEWHAFLECPLHNAARGRFSLATGYIFPTSLTPCTAVDLASLVSFVRQNAHMVGHLATFALNIRSTRRHLFRRLGTDGPSGRHRVLMRVVWERWQMIVRL